MDQAHSIEEIHDPDIGSLGTIVRLLVPWQLEVYAFRNFFFADPISKALGAGIVICILVQPMSCVSLFSAVGRG